MVRWLNNMKKKGKYLKKEKANKKENTKVKKDKKCTTKFYNSLPKYMIYIKSRFSTRITRWRSTKLLGLVETHIQEEEKITIGYKIIYRNYKTSNSGGIIIAVKDAIKTITIQVMQESQVGQTLWILLNNQKKKINVRVIHAL